MIKGKPENLELAMLYSSSIARTQRNGRCARCYLRLRMKQHRKTPMPTRIIALGSGTGTTEALKLSDVDVPPR